MKLDTAIKRLTPNLCYYYRETVFISAVKVQGFSSGSVAMQNAIKRLQAHPEKVRYAKTSKGERFYSLSHNGMSTRIWFS